MTIDLTKLAAPFPPEKIHWRVGATTKDKTRGLALAYIDARDVMERLDEVCGPENWQRRYVNAGNGRTCCEIGINILGGKFDESGNLQALEMWVWKGDGAGDTDVEGAKGSFSDAFKRAAVNWGIGRYLYDVKSPWVQLEKQGNTHVIKESELGKLRQCLLADAPRPSQAKPAKQSAPAKNDDAGIYVATAKTVIGTFTNVEGARTWWKNEAPHRKKAGLSPAQEQELIDAIGNKFPATLTKEEAA